MVEPSAEPVQACSPGALHLRIAAEAALPSLKALLDAQDLLPQQALGSLGFVCEVLNRLLVNLNDSISFAKFSRIKVGALHKKIPRRPELAESVLRSAGFSPAGEYLEWALGRDENLAAALAVLALAARIQEMAQGGSGLRTLLQQPLDVSIGIQQVLALTYGGCRLLEKPVKASTTEHLSAGGIEGALVRREWLVERIPGFAKALEEFLTLFETGTREKALVRAIGRALGEHRQREGLSRFSVSVVLAEVAQLAAGAALVALRRPETVNCKRPAQPEQEAEPDELVEVDQLAKPSIAGEAGDVVAVLLGYVPAFRLGIEFQTMSDIARLSEAPSFFTAGVREKNFEVSLASLAHHFIQSWLKQADYQQALKSPSFSSIGIGCSINIGNDDKAIVFVLIA